VPDPQAHLIERNAPDEIGNNLRAALLAANDALTSNLSLMLEVAGAGLCHRRFC
jgi:VIT1/CCC1 family predicted Fe2+/Mn2+ transporter